LRSYVCQSSIGFCLILLRYASSQIRILTWV